jgi:hypothetical protein
MKTESEDRTCGTCKHFDNRGAYCGLWGMRTKADGWCDEWSDGKATERKTTARDAAKEGGK